MTVAQSVPSEVKRAAHYYVAYGDTVLGTHTPEIEAFLAGYEYAHKGPSVLGMESDEKTEIQLLREKIKELELIIQVTNER